MSVWLLAGSTCPSSIDLCKEKAPVFSGGRTVVKLCENCVKSWLHLTSNLVFA